MEVHPEIYCSLGVLSKQLGVTARYLSATKFLLEVPYCTEVLRWQLTFAKVGAQCVPDFLFEEEDFLPLLGSATVSSCLQKGALEAQSLLLLVRALLSSYAEYQRKRLESVAAHDSRLKFEVETLLDRSSESSDVHVLTNSNRVIFVVRVGDGLDCQSILPSISGCGSPPHDIEALQRDIKLKVSWSLSASGASSAVPGLQLLLPSQLGELLGKVELPVWPPHGMCTLEYIPEVKSALQRSCQQAVAALSSRRDFFLKGLTAAGLGKPLEFDATTCSTASYQLHDDEGRWLLSVDLTNKFPQQKPRVTIQGGSSGESRTVDQGTWDPRWSTNEMAMQIYKSVRSCL